MRTPKKGINSLLLVGCALACGVSVPVYADNGIIVITRDVQPRIATTRPLAPDPYPTTANANPSAHILTQTNELSDGDFAGISSGSGISTLITQQTNNMGANISPQSQLPNLAGGRGAGSGGNGISNMVNSGVQKGMGALNILTGGQ